MPSKNKVLIDRIAQFLVQHGGLQNHGHRKVPSACAECQLVNEILDVAGLQDEHLKIDDEPTLVPETPHCVYCHGFGSHGDELTGGESYCLCPAGVALKNSEQ